MENTRPQPCGQAHVQDAFHLEAIRDDAGRKALFVRMCREGLTGCAMYAWPHPREDDWLHLVSAPGRLLLQATAPDGTALACGLFSPWRGRIREFDFTVFRPAFPLSVPLARAAFRWVFRHTETSALWGLCPAMPGVWPRPAVSSSRDACPPPAGWPGAASMWTASSCSARRRRWRAP